MGPDAKNCRRSCSRSRSARLLRSPCATGGRRCSGASAHRWGGEEPAFGPPETRCPSTALTAARSLRPRSCRWRHPAGHWAHVTHIGQPDHSVSGSDVASIATRAGRPETAGSADGRLLSEMPGLLSPNALFRGRPGSASLWPPRVAPTLNSRNGRSVVYWWTWLVIVAAVAGSLVAFWVAELATRPKQQSLVQASPTARPDVSPDR